MSSFIHVLVGACLGSHAAWLADSFRKNCLHWRSRCSYCGQELSFADEIPIISYLYLHGKCRYCQSSIPASLFAAEIWGALSFLPFSFNKQSLAAAIIAFYFLTMAILDLQTKMIDLRLLVVPTFAAILACGLNHLLPALVLCLLLAVFAKSGLLGSGDVYCLAVLGIFWQQRLPQLLLLACLFCLVSQLLLKSRKAAFVPYLYLAHLCFSWVYFYA